MPSNKLTMTLFLLFLEMVLTSVVADDTETTFADNAYEDFNGTTETSTANITNLPASTVNITDNSNTSTPAPQNNKNGSITDSFTSVFSSNGSKAATIGPTTALVRPTAKPTPSPMTLSTKRKTNTTVKTTTVKIPAPAPESASADHIVIIVLGLIVLVVIACGAICFFTRRRVRRYSVDLTHRVDECNIPLSTMEPEVPAESVPLNGLQTFEGTETSAKEPEKPEVKPETQEEQKTEVGEPAADPMSASAAAAAAPAPAPDSSEDKPKENAVEGSSPATEKPNSEEKTDDEGAVSNKTSVESLKETNENNSNNAGSGQETDVQTGNTLQEVCVDCVV